MVMFTIQLGLFQYLTFEQFRSRRQTDITSLYRPLHFTSDNTGLAWDRITWSILISQNPLSSSNVCNNDLVYKLYVVLAISPKTVSLFALVIWRYVWCTQCLLPFWAYFYPHCHANFGCSRSAGAGRVSCCGSAPWHARGVRFLSLAPSLGNDTHS